MSTDTDPPPPYEAQYTAPTIAAPLAQTVQSTFYHVYRTKMGNYRVLLDDQTPSFYLNCRTIRTPDLIVHHGTGDVDLQVASCKFPEFNNFYDINVFQKINNKFSGIETKMTLNGRFIATVPIQVATGDTVRVQRPFIWKHTSSLVLMDEETGQTAAALHGMAFGLAKCFVLEIQVPYGYGWDLLIVTSAMTIYESRRREYSRPSGTRLNPSAGAHVRAASQGGFAALTGGSMGGAIGGGGF